jgi:hypothetical protein
MSGTTKTSCDEAQRLLPTSSHVNTTRTIASPWCEAVIDENNHWITVFMRAEVGAEVEATNMEPDKCEGWHWMDWGESVPEPRFLPLDIILKDKSYSPV